MTQAFLTIVLVLAQSQAQSPSRRRPASIVPQAVAPARPQAAPSGPSPVPAPEVRPAGAAGEGYRIGVGDVLRVVRLRPRGPDADRGRPPGGSFSFPLVGMVAAAGATTEEVEERIATQLARGYLRDAHVSVAVQEYRSQVVFVVGDLARPGPTRSRERRGSSRSSPARVRCRRARAARS